MRSRGQKISALTAIAIMTLLALTLFLTSQKFEKQVVAQEKTAKANPSPTPGFDQEAALAKLREQIKGKEKMPAGEVFENVKQFDKVPAGRLLAIMKFGYARSLGVDCTHCHTPDKWADESKPQKQIARDMREMSAKINGELLSSIEAFEGRTGRNRPVVNCTTCHRGEVKPATNLPRPKSN